MDFLQTIYTRFQHIAVYIAAVNWINKNETSQPKYLKANQIAKSNEVFGDAEVKIMQVLCEIHTTILDMGKDPQVNISITPENLENSLKLKHWLVYREYDNLLDYATELMALIIDDKKNNGK